MTETDLVGWAWLPLQGVQVLNFTFLLPGTLATRYLADLGANVVKVGPPSGDLDPELGDSRYDEEKGRLRRGDELSERQREVMRLRPAAEWMRLFERNDVPAELGFDPAEITRLREAGVFGMETGV